MSTFIELVKNDLNIAKIRKFKTWSKIYFAIAIIFVIVSYTIQLLYDHVYPEFIIALPLFLLFPIFFVSVRLTKREWSMKTIGWWLSLPYSRRFLLGAKFTAAFIRSLRYILIIALISSAFWIEGLLIRPDLWNNSNLSDILMRACEMYALVLVFCPACISFGLLIAVVRRSAWRPATPLIFITFGFFISSVTSRIFGYEANNYKWPLDISIYNNDITLAFIIAASCVIAAIMFFLSVYLLESQVEI